MSDIIIGTQKGTPDPGTGLFTVTLQATALDEEFTSVMPGLFNDDLWNRQAGQRVMEFRKQIKQELECY